MKKILLLYLLCIIHLSCRANILSIQKDQEKSEKNHTKQKITLAKIRTYFIKNPEKNLMLTIMLSCISHHWIKNILEYMNHDITFYTIDDPFDNNYRMDLIKLSHITPVIFFFSKLFYDSFQTKKYIARQDGLIAKLKKQSKEMRSTHTL